MQHKLSAVKKKGQGLVEYALILVLIAVVVILIMSFIGNQQLAAFSKIASTVNP